MPVGSATSPTNTVAKQPTKNWLIRVLDNTGNFADGIHKELDQAPTRLKDGSFASKLVNTILPSTEPALFPLHGLGAVLFQGEFELINQALQAEVPGKNVHEKIRYLLEEFYGNTKPVAEKSANALVEKANSVLKNHYKIKDLDVLHKDLQAYSKKAAKKQQGLFGKVQNSIHPQLMQGVTFVGPQVLGMMTSKLGQSLGGGPGQILNVLSSLLFVIPSLIIGGQLRSLDVRALSKNPLMYNLARCGRAFMIPIELLNAAIGIVRTIFDSKGLEDPSQSNFIGKTADFLSPILGIASQILMISSFGARHKANLNLIEERYGNHANYIKAGGKAAGWHLFNENIGYWGNIFALFASGIFSSISGIVTNNHYGKIEKQLQPINNMEEQLASQAIEKLSPLVQSHKITEEQAMQVVQKIVSPLEMKREAIIKQATGGFWGALAKATSIADWLAWVPVEYQMLCGNFSGLMSRTLALQEETGLSFAKSFGAAANPKNKVSSWQETTAAMGGPIFWTIIQLFKGTNAIFDPDQVPGALKWTQNKQLGVGLQLASQFGM
jgi:hypothetical protein